MPRQNRSLHVVRSSRPEEGKREPALRRAQVKAIRLPPTRGTLSGLTADGHILACWGAQEDPREVSFALHVPRRVLLDAVERRAPVLIDFVDGDDRQPVIVGLLRDRIGAEPAESAAAGTIDLEDVTIRGGRSLSLECGQSAITLTHTGRVTIRGTEVVSESSGAVKLKGAYVELN